MIRTAHTTMKKLASQPIWRGLVGTCGRLLADRDGNTAIEYALTLAGIALGGTGLTSAIGVDLNAIFGGLHVEFCQQLHNVCVVN